MDDVQEFLNRALSRLDEGRVYHATSLVLQAASRVPASERKPYKRCLEVLRLETRRHDPERAAMREAVEDLRETVA